MFSVSIGWHHPCNSDNDDRRVYVVQRVSTVVCHGVIALLVEKFSDDEFAVRVEESGVVVSLAEYEHELSRKAAASLRRVLGESLTERREFLHTAGTHRADGTYVVSRCGADSAGHSKVFESFERLCERYASLPTEFTAADVAWPGLTGGRRHLLVRHFAEHPTFVCELVSRQPLTVTKYKQESPEIAADELSE